MEKKVKLCREDKIFYAVIGVFLTVITLAILYPLIYIVSASFSSASAVSSGKVFLWPVDFSVEGYKAVFRNKDILTGYVNTIFYTVAGTLFNLFMTLIAAYPLSRKDLPGRNFLSFFFSSFFLIKTCTE